MAYHLSRFIVLYRVWTSIYLACGLWTCKTLFVLCVRLCGVPSENFLFVKLCAMLVWLDLWYLCLWCSCDGVLLIFTLLSWYIFSYASRIIWWHFAPHLIQWNRCELLEFVQTAYEAILEKVELMHEFRGSSSIALDKWFYFWISCEP